MSILVTASPASTMHAWKPPQNGNTSSPLRGAPAAQLAETRPKYLASSQTQRWESNVCTYSRPVPDASHQRCGWQRQQPRSITHGLPATLLSAPSPPGPANKGNSEPLSRRGAREAVVLPGSFREKILRPVSHGGCRTASTPRCAARLPMPGPPLLRSRRLQGGEHTTGLSEQGCSASPLLSSPQRPQRSTCQANRPRAGSSLFIQDLFSFNHFN